MEADLAPTAAPTLGWPATPPATSSTAQSPFDNCKGADVVLRTCDHVDFYLHKLILRFASPFFDDMFSLPQPLSDSDPETVLTPTGVRLPLIHTTEDSKFIDVTLRFSYPIVHPPLPTDLTVLAGSLAAALKYELRVATKSFQAHLHTFIPSQTLSVYATACLLHLETVASAAATVWRQKYLSSIGSGTCSSSYHGYDGISYTPCGNTLCVYRDPLYDTPGSISGTAFGATYTEEIKAIPAGCYFRLLEYLRHGHAGAAFYDPPPPNPQDLERQRMLSPSLIREDFLVRFPADIALASSDGEIIHTHQMILALAAGVQGPDEKPLPADQKGGGISILAEAQASDVTLHEGMPLVGLEEDEASILTLLQVCYGFSSGAYISPDQILAVESLAQKYTMSNLLRYLEGQWTKAIKDGPLAAYLAAFRFGNIERVKQAARATLVDSVVPGTPIEEVYVREMEDIPAEPLYLLYRYHFSYRQQRSQVLRRYREANFSPGSGNQAHPPADTPRRRENLFSIAIPIVHREARDNRSGRSSTGQNWTAEVAAQLVFESHTLMQELEVVADAVPYIYQLQSPNIAVVDLAGGSTPSLTSPGSVGLGGSNLKSKKKKGKR